MQSARNGNRKWRNRPRSWGAVSGLLTACAVTLIGTTVGLEPHVILWRATLSSVIMAAVVSFGISVVYLANSPS